MVPVAQIDRMASLVSRSVIEVKDHILASLNSDKEFLLPEIILNTCKPEQLKSLMEVAFKSCLLECLEDGRVPKLLDISILAMVKEYGDPTLTFILIEEWAECSAVWQLPALFEFLESRQSILTENISSGRGKGLILLRICNEIIKRLSKSQDSQICGKVLLFLSKVFALGERSGVNLRGDLNSENVTPLDHSVSDSTFYYSFWRLQYFMYHPVQALMSENWGFVKKTLEETLTTFEKVKPLLANDCSDHSKFYPKYLSDKELFSLQITDSKWREVVLVQITIFLQHLLAFASKEDYKPPSAKSLPTSLINTDQETWVAEFNRKTLSYISSNEVGNNLYRTIKWILKCEKNWMIWKSLSCPNFEKSPEPSFLPGPATNHLSNYMEVSSIINPNNLGSKELSRLWKYKSDLGIETREAKPSIENYLRPLYEQLDPAEGIEPEYRCSRDEIFRWKFLRILMSDESAIENFSKCKSPKDLDLLCEKFFKNNSDNRNDSRADMPVESKEEETTLIG